jgi:hypothetical protein
METKEEIFLGRPRLGLFIGGFVWLNFVLGRSKLAAVCAYQKFIKDPPWSNYLGHFLGGVGKYVEYKASPYPPRE